MLFEYFNIIYSSKSRAFKPKTENFLHLSLTYKFFYNKQTFKVEKL